MTVTFVEAVYQIFLTGLHVRFVKLVYIILSTIAYQTFTFANIRWLILFSRHTPHLPVLVHGHKIEWLPIVDIVLNMADEKNSAKYAHFMEKFNEVDSGDICKNFVPDFVINTIK